MTLGGKPRWFLTRIPGATRPLPAGSPVLFFERADKRKVAKLAPSSRPPPPSHQFRKFFHQRCDFARKRTREKHMKTPMKYTFFGCVLGLMTTVGCGGGSDRPPLYPVEGIVTYNNDPVGNASVVFMPKEGLVAIGRTDETGKYKLLTQGAEGAMAGDFDVVVNASEQLKEATAEEVEGMSDRERAQLNRSLIPARYSKRETSQLTATVKEGEGNTFNFDLKD